MKTRGGGKLKGAQFEREICLDLSLWISGGKLQDCFWRSAMSGGRATRARLAGTLLEAQRGDLTPIRREGMAFSYLFHAECKFYRDLRVDRMLEPPLDNTVPGLNQFWTKLRKVCERDNDLPILFAKQNNWEPFVVLNTRGLQVLGLDIWSWIVRYTLHDAYIVPLEVFLKKASLPKLQIGGKK